MEGDAYKKILHMEVRLNTTFWGIPGGGKVTAIIINTKPFAVSLMFFYAKKNEYSLSRIAIRVLPLYSHSLLPERDYTG